MNGRNRQKTRIEPRFDAPAGRHHGAPDASARPVPSRASRGSRGKAAKPKRQKRSLVGSLFYWSFVLGIWGALAVGGVVAFYTVKLPASSSWSVPERPPNARIVSVNGRLLANRGATGGESMRISEMSPYIPMAVIAIEDRRFKSHFGVDPIGLARAMATNLVEGRLVQGGSTITQQLAKNLFLEPERTIERKVQEAVLALWLERKFTKDEILELYLNRVYFGSGAYGVDAAARRYFNKSARDVNLAEAALLAGLLKAPSALSPARNPEGANDRAQVVLASMRRAGFVTDREITTALSMEASKAKRYWSGPEHYVADMVMRELPGLIGEMRQDVVVDTTIDGDLERIAGRLISDAIANSGTDRNVSQGALVAIDGTGAIRALVGGAEYSESQFNRATEAKRQPGSAFKPLVYLAALEEGRTPETVRVDRAVKIGNWEPENYDRKFRGPVTLSEALSMSLNTISAQLIAEVGARKVAETARKMGIKSEIARNASIALGTSEVTLSELTSAYAPFANGGYLAEPYLIRRVTAADGTVLYERGSPPSTQVISSQVAGMMNAMMMRTVEEGTGKAAQVPGWQVAGKTGTSQNFRDALFIGYTANLVTGVWFGNDDGTPTSKLTGGSLPAEVFGEFMTAAHKGVPNAELPGHYLPQTVAVIPTPRPGTLLQQSAGGQPAVPATQFPAPGAGPGEPLRRPLSDVTGSVPRPGGLLGRDSRQARAGEEQRPRRIIDLILGNDG